MANNVAITAGSGTTVCTTDISSFSSYSSSGQVPAGAIYCSANTSTAPAPVTNANPLPVAIQGTAAVTQSGTWNVGTVTAVTSITNPVAATQSGSWTVAATQSGTWNVGTVTTVSTVTAVTTLSTLTTVTNPVITSLNSAAINNGTTALTPKFAAIAASTSGNNTIVTAVSGKKIRVLAYRFSANGTVAAKWRSSTAGDISGLSYLTQYASAGAGFSPIGHFETASGEGLQLNLDGAVAVGGHVSYVEV